MRILIAEDERSPPAPEGSDRIVGLRRDGREDGESALAPIAAGLAADRSARLDAARYGGTGGLPQNSRAR